MPVRDQVKHGIQKDPDNIDEMPVQADVFNGRVVLRRVVALPSKKSNYADNSDSDDQVDSVNAGHDEVQREENFRVPRVPALGKFITRAGDVVLLPFLVIFKALVHQEYGAEQHRYDKHHNQHLARTYL